MKMPSIALTIVLAWFTSADPIDAQTVSEVVLTRGATVDLAISTIANFDRTSKRISVITADGARELFELDDRCTIDTAAGIEKTVAGASDHVLKKGGLVVLYFTEEGRQRVVHAIDEISRKA
jgi:hypothetical protein